MIRRLSYYAEEAARTPFEQFAAAHQHHVLVVLPPNDTSSESFHTTDFGSKVMETRPPIDGRYRVAPLTRRIDGHPLSVFLTVGRAGTNDIVLKDIEVSKTHAIFEEDSQGNWTVRDNDSTNGTFLNAQRVALGGKRLVRSSDTIRFGGLSAVFFNQSDFYQFLRSREVVDGLLDE